MPFRKFALRRVFPTSVLVLPVHHDRLGGGLCRGCFVAVLLGLILFAGCGESSKKVKLAMKFYPGREVTYEQTNEQKVSRNDPYVLVMVSRSKGEMTQKVIEMLDQGTAKIEDQSVSSWSEQDADSTIRVVSRTEKMTYQMAANGKISALEILSDDNASKWKEYAQSNLEQSQPTFPDQPVGKGYTWMQTVKIIQVAGEMLDASTTYEVIDFIEVDGHKCAAIDYKGNLILPFDVTESDTLIRKGVDKVDVVGTLYFDYEGGYVFSQQEKTKVTAERQKILATEAISYTAYIEGDLYFHLKSVK
jgi:hypothetical protein